MYNKVDDSVSYFLDKFRLCLVSSLGNSPSFKNFFIEDVGSSRFNFNDAIFRFLNDDHDVLDDCSSFSLLFSRSLLVFPDHNRSFEPPMQMSFSVDCNSLFVLAGGDGGKFQPLRMSFESYPSPKAYGVNQMSFQEFGGHEKSLNFLKNYLIT